VADARMPGPASCSDDDTERLFFEYRRTGDARVRERLVRLNENLARFLASKFANRGEPLDDLVQVAMVGLIHAVDRFEPRRGNRFSTYATPTIVGEIKRYFRDRSWNLKVPRWLQELNRRVMRANDDLGLSLGRAPNVGEIAHHVGCSEEQALAAIELGAAHEMLSLDSPVAVGGEAAPLTLKDALGDLDVDLERIEFRDEVQAALRKLDRRERAIICLRFFNELPQSEVARRLQISQMHVSRLQQRALQRLKSILIEERAAGRMEAA
jgi:RNA polymerase sigma-B factor